MSGWPRGTKPKSAVWKYYEWVTTDDDTGTVLKCRFCLMSFSAAMARNATKLRQHLQRKCPHVTDDVKQSFPIDDTINNTVEEGMDNSSTMSGRPRGKKPKCDVWKHYEWVAIDDDRGSVLKCRYCLMSFTPAMSKNATKLRQHLTDKCPDVTDDVKQSFPTIIADDMDNTVGEDTDYTPNYYKKTKLSHKSSKLKVKKQLQSALKCESRRLHFKQEEYSDVSKTPHSGGATAANIDLLNRTELKSRVYTLEEENHRLVSRLELCLKQNEALIQMTKHLEHSLHLMEKLESINKIHSIRFDDNEEEVLVLTDELSASNGATNEWKDKLKTIEMQFTDNKHIEDNYQKNIERISGQKSQRPQSTIWKYYKMDDKDDEDGMRVIQCIFCDKTFRHKNLNAFKSRTHIVENCEKCPQDIKDKENIWSEPQTKSKVDIWSHFQLTTNSEDKKCAECQYCGHKYYYKNATKCRQHLVFKCLQIPIEVKETIRNKCDETFLNNSKCQEPAKTRQSNIWNHYTNYTDDQGKLGYCCSYCGQIYMTRNATKFRQHLVDRCENIPSNLRKELSTESIESGRTWTQAKVPVWSHFKLYEEYGKHMSRCSYCGITYAYRNATKCRIHLMLKCDKIPHDLRHKIRKESNELYMSALNAKTDLKIKKKLKTKKVYVKTGGIPRKPKSRIWDHFTDDKDPKGDNIRRCNYCDQTFGTGTSRNATKMRDHLALYCKSIDADIKNKIIDDTAKFGRLYRNKPQEAYKWLECCWPGCDMKFPKKSRLLNHQKVHTGDIARVPCDWPGCEWTGRSKHCVTVHKYTHTGEKPYECDWPGCEFKTAKPSSLCIHKMRHKNLLRYKCDWPECERIFLTSSQRTVHKMVHLGIKPHACQFCDKRYPQLNKLKVHQNKHHYHLLRTNSHDSL